MTATDIEDARVLPADLRARLARWWRELADDERSFGNHERAADCLRRACVLEAEGALTLAQMLEAAA